MTDETPPPPEEPERPDPVEPELPDIDEAVDPASKILAAIANRAPFGPEFFAAVLADRLRVHCPGAEAHVSIVLLHLADGAVLDLCHIVELTPKWMCAAVFRAEMSCDEMDLEFLPYELITRVTLSRRPSGERHLGFDLDRSPRAVDDDPGPDSVVAPEA